MHSQRSRGSTPERDAPSRSRSRGSCRRSAATGLRLAAGARGADHDQGGAPRGRGCRCARERGGTGTPRGTPRAAARPRCASARTRSRSPPPGPQIDAVRRPRRPAGRRAAPPRSRARAAARSPTLSPDPHAEPASSPQRERASARSSRIGAGRVAGSRSRRARDARWLRALKPGLDAHGRQASLARMSETATEWVAAGDYTDIRYERSSGEDAGIAKITINRPEVRNAFRPQTVVELCDAFDARARGPRRSASIILTGEGPDAFCSGGDQRVRGDSGYVSEEQPTRRRRATRRRALPRHRPARPDPPHCPSRSWRWSPATRSAAATCCTSSATSRSPPTTRASARAARAWAPSTAASARASSPRQVGQEGARRSGSSAASTTPEQALEMGLVNAVVPLGRARARDGRLVPRDARALAVRAAPAEGELQRRRGRPRRASSSSPTTPTSSSTAARRRARAATPSSRSARPTSRSSRAAP